MWIFTTVGFFSVVQKPGERRLCVRARAAGDLDRLRDQFMPELGPTTSKEGSDYPFRARIEREAFARGLAALGQAIRYDNFKDEVERVMGKRREKLYEGVWGHLACAKEEAWGVPPPR